VCLNDFHHFSDICHCLFLHQSSIIHPRPFSDQFYIYLNQISITGCVLVPFLRDPNVKHCLCSHKSCILDSNVQHFIKFWRGESTRASHSVSRGGSVRTLLTVSRVGQSEHHIQCLWVGESEHHMQCL
jgi:hypothetical protein